MTFGAALTFDPRTDESLRGLHKAQAQAGLPAFMLSLDYPPHLTLMAADEVEHDQLRAALAPLAAATPPLQVDFLSLGLFAAQYGVVYLAPVVTQALLDLHAAFWQTVEPLTTRPFHYHHPGVWVPHVTLAYGLAPDQIGPVATFLASQAWPREATITGILYGEFNTAGGSRLEFIPLG